jgi:hypothetical protein
LTIWKRLRNGVCGTSTREALAPPTYAPGATLREKIASKTEAFFADQHRPQGWDGAWRSDDDYLGWSPAPKRPWWRFW